METKVIISREESPKLFGQITSLMSHIDGSNNYEATHVYAWVEEAGLVVETVCINEYGSKWGNNDEQFIPKEELPFFTIKKLYGID